MLAELILHILHNTFNNRQWERTTPCDFTIPSVQVCNVKMFLWLKKKITRAAEEIDIPAPRVRKQNMARASRLQEATRAVREKAVARGELGASNGRTLPML